MPKDVKKRIIIEVDDKGDLKKTKKKIDALNKSSDRASKSSMEYNRNMKGLSKQSSNASKNFSKQAQGMQGVLVPAYAEIAARVFALSAAFMALSKAADYAILIQGQQAYARMTGKNMASIARSVQVASKHMLDFKEASTSVALASTSGIGSQQIVAMTKAAVDSSAALGRSVTDTMDRLTRGIVKAEPEILDEIGVIIRLDKVYKDYAETLMKTSQELTEAEKATARYNAIMGQLENKFGGIADTLDPNYFAALSATIMDIINKVTSFGVTYLAGPLKFLTESKTLLVAIMALVLKSIGGKIFPALTGLGSKLTEMPAKMQGRIEKLQGSIKTLNAEIKGSAAEIDKFNKRTKGARMTPGMEAARKSGDIKKYTRLQSAAIKRAEASLEGDGRKRVKGGMLKGMNLKQIELLKKETIELDKIQTKWQTKQQIELKKHSAGIKGLQLSYQKMKLGISKFGAQQVELLNMSFSEGIRQIGRNWKTTGHWASGALNTMKAGLSGVTVLVKGLGTALNAAFKIFIWVTMIWSMVKTIGSLFIDFDKPFKKAAESAKALNAELKTTLENLNERPDSISFEGVAASFTDALKNANFAANLADEIYNATHKAMVHLSKEMAEMGWLDRLIDKIKALVGKDTFEDVLRKNVGTAIKLAKTSGMALPQGLQDALAKEVARDAPRAADINKKLADAPRYRATEAGFKSEADQLAGVDKQGIMRKSGDIIAGQYHLYVSMIEELAAQKDNDIAMALSGLGQNELIQYLDELDQGFGQSNESLKKHQQNVKELGQTFNKVSKYSREYAESMLSKTEFYDLAKTQTALQNLFDQEDVTKSEKVLGAIEAGYMTATQELKDYQKEFDDAVKKNQKMQRGEGGVYSDEAKQAQKEEVARLRLLVSDTSRDLWYTNDVAVILGKNYVEIQKVALRHQTKKLGLDHEAKSLQIFGNYALERQTEIKQILLQQERTDLNNKILAGDLDDAALANAKEQLRLKGLLIKVAGATALKQAEHEAKIEGKKLNIMERYTAMRKDLITKYGTPNPAQGMSREGEQEFALLEAMKKGEISTFFNKYAEGLDKSLKLTRSMAEWTAIWADASEELKNKVRAAQQVMLKGNAWGGQKLSEAEIFMLGQSGSLATGAALQKQRNTDALMKDPMFERNRSLIAIALEVQKIREKNIDDDLKLTEEKMYLETEHRKALQAYEDAAWKERAKVWADAMKTIADSFGSGVTQAFNDMFESKGWSTTTITQSLGAGMRGAASNMIGAQAQKAAFGNQGFLANFMGGILDKDGSTKWQDALFPKTDVEMRREQLTIFQRWDKDGIKINTLKGGGIAANFMRDASSEMNPFYDRQKQAGGGARWAEGLHGIYESMKEGAINLMHASPHIMDWWRVLSGGMTGGANGGIASGGFRAFANGGIANRPTLGMIGEGRYNEAVVPLPDGKSIPISGGAGNVTVNVAVDAQGQSAATEVSGDGARELGYKISQAVQSELVEQQRPGGLLSSY